MATTNVYELTYIVNSVLSEEHIKDIVARVNKFIDDHGGEVMETDEWGTRRLAYPISKRRNGYYVNAHFRGGGELVSRLERALEIEDDVMRYLTLRFDPKMLRHYEARKQGAAPASGSPAPASPVLASASASPAPTSPASPAASGASDTEDETDDDSSD